MAAPKPITVYKPGVAPSKSTYAVNPKTGALSYQQLQKLWIDAGGPASVAPLMAAIALAESGGSPLAHNGNAATGDDSYGLWQINYYDKLRASRTQRYGPTSEITDPLKNAKAAVDLYNNGKGLHHWQGDAAYKAYTTGGADGLNAFLASHSAKLTVQEATTLAQTQADSPAYVQATTDLSTIKSQARASAEAAQHVQDPWVVQNLDKAGNVTSFSYSTGINPPKASKTQQPFEYAGAPLTKSQLADLWDSRYAGTYEDFTGKAATPQQISQIVESGSSVYKLRSDLAAAKSFTSSPIYKANAAGLQDTAKSVLGKNAPEDFIRKAIAENWDADTFKANIRTDLPKQYEAGPEFQTNKAQMTSVYKGIYGSVDPTVDASITDYTKAGWTPLQFSQHLRTMPQYKQSPEYRTGVLSFLDQLGLVTGTQSTLTPSSAGKPVATGAGINPTVQSFKPALAGAPGVGV